MTENKKKRPSRKGVSIKPHKGGRTAPLFLTITPDALTKLKAITAARKQSRSDYLQEKIDEDYKKLPPPDAIPPSTVIES